VNDTGPGQFGPHEAQPDPHPSPALNATAPAPQEMPPDPSEPSPSGPALPPLVPLGPSVSDTRAGGRSWLRWAVPAGALVVGLATGAATVVATSDPTTTDEYRSLARTLEQARDDIDQAEGQRRTAEDAARRAEATAQQSLDEAAARQQSLDAREQGLVVREQAVIATEQRIAATSIDDGIWSVGVDIEPGTYRTAQPVRSDCYWGIYASGTNGDDIIENDIVNGGFPTVTLREGQDFENNGCGTFVKQ
jgi:hypothetical protein